MCFVPSQPSIVFSFPQLRGQHLNEHTPTLNAPWTPLTRFQGHTTTTERRTHLTLLFQISHLLEEVQRHQLTISKLQESSIAQISRLEEQLEQKRQHIARLENKLESQRDYDELRRELGYVLIIRFKRSSMLIYSSSLGYRDQSSRTA